MKDELIQRVIGKGYNVGFGANKTYASFDILTKTPSFLSFISIAVGILGLLFDCLTSKYISVLMTLLGITLIYVGKYTEEDRLNYKESAEELNYLFDKLHALLITIRSNNTNDFSNEEKELNDISKRYAEISESDQVFLSDWYAHYKFFGQKQASWLKEERDFSLIKDKLPFSFIPVFIVLIAPISVYIFMTISHCFTTQICGA